jgi:exosome complex RNA-binding protein Csl4
MLREEKVIEAKCVVCKGNLMKTEYWQYNPASGPPIIGPGSKNQYFKQQSLRCPACGLKYVHEPKV